MSKSKININEIFQSHFMTLKDDKGDYIKKDISIFFVYPIFIGILTMLFIGFLSDSMINVFATCLSVLIGLFLNLLILLVSFSENKLNIKDISNRRVLLEQTFFNITYTIVASMIGLALLFLCILEPNRTIFNFVLKIPQLGSFLLDNITYLKYLFTLYKIITCLLFYAFFSHIIFTLLMIVKRVYSFFKVEIKG